MERFKKNKILIFTLILTVLVSLLIIFVIFIFSGENLPGTDVDDPRMTTLTIDVGTDPFFSDTSVASFQNAVKEKGLWEIDLSPFDVIKGDGEFASQLLAASKNEETYWWFTSIIFDYLDVEEKGAASIETLKANGSRAIVSINRPIKKLLYTPVNDQRGGSFSDFYYNFGVVMFDMETYEKGNVYIYSTDFSEELYPWIGQFMICNVTEDCYSEYLEEDEILYLKELCGLKDYS